MGHKPDAPAVDLERIVDVLDRHGVEYLLVGGGAARIYGAQRPTQDTDCLARRTHDNLERLATAMREMRARLRVSGMPDEQAAALPVHLDATTLSGMEISTWSTDAGWFDVLTDLPARDGRRQRYEDLIPSAVTLEVGSANVRIAALEAIIASKEWANRPKDHDALPELRTIAANRPSGPTPG